MPAYAVSTLTGTYEAQIGGTPAEGFVEIIPSVKVIKDTAGNVILTGRRKITLDETGSFSTSLPATDDPGLNPTGFGYTIVAKLRHQHLPAVSFYAPGGTTQDVEDLTSVDPATFDPTATYAESADVTALDARVTTLETTPAVTSYNDLTDKPVIPDASGHVLLIDGGAAVPAETPFGALIFEKVSATYSEVILADSPVGYWRLDEASGTTLVDSSGAARNGTYTGAPTFGQVALLPNGDGTSVTLGTADYATVAHDAAFNVTTAGFTFEAWVKITNPNLDALQVIADKTNMSLATNHQWYIGYENRSSQGSPQRIQLGCDLSGGSDLFQWDTAATPTELAAGGHLAVVVETNADVKIYWNGAVVTTDTAATGMVDLVQSTQALRLGTGGANTFPLTGALDEVAIYATPLTAERILAHYNAGV